MFKTFKCLFDIFWLMDIMNLPFMKEFDTTYPLNGLFWTFAIIIVAYESGSQGVKLEVKKDE